MPDQSDSTGGALSPDAGSSPRSRDPDLTVPAHGAPPIDTDGVGPGIAIGPYRLLELIGEGGFGEVWLAQQTGPIARRVAIKVIKAGMDSKAVIARFEQERQALGVMDHPNIAKVFDAGTTARGRPYFVMEHVKGAPITRYCDTQRLTVAQRLRLFEPVCNAVQHAHMKGIIHRDLKPSNILVAVSEGGAPRPVVIDFGVAKAIARTLTEKTIFTEQGQLIGTPEYMSPEQAEMAETDIDTRTDVYALGVVLYELLTGALPFDPGSLRAAGYAAIQKMIREVEAPRPSTRLSSMGDGAARAAEARRAGLVDLAAQLRGELEWIPLKALRKDRTERYRSAADLGDDIGNYLAHRPLIAGPESAAYQLRKMLRRHRGPAAAGAAVFVTLVLGFVTTLWQANIAKVQRDQAERLARSESVARAEADEKRLLADQKTAEAVDARAAETRERLRARQALDFVMETLKSSDPYEGGRQDIPVSVAMSNAIKKLDAGDFKNEPAIHADLRITIGNILRGNGRAAEAERQAVRALEILREIHPGDHDDVATGLNNLALAREALGRPAEAEQLHVQALEMRTRLFDDGPELANSLNNLASVRLALGRPAEAEPLFERALDIRRRFAHGDDPHVAESLNNLAALRLGLDRPKEAEALFVEALDMQQRLQDGDHPNVATSMGNVAFVWDRLGRASDAEPLYVRAIEMERRMFRTGHPDLARNLANLARLLRNAGRNAEAEPLLTEALEVDRRLYQTDHPSLAMSLSNLGQAREALGRIAEAEPLYREALEMRLRLFSGDSAEVERSLTNLANAQAAQGRDAEAEPLYAQSFAMSARLHSSDDPTVAESLVALAKTRERLGRFPEAEPLWRRLFEIRSRALPPDDWRIASAKSLLGGSIARQGRFEEAEPLVVEGFEGLFAARRILNNVDRLWEACGRVVALYEAWNTADPGKGHDTMAETWRARRDALIELAPDGEPGK